MQTKICFMVVEIWLWMIFGNIFKGVCMNPEKLRSGGLDNFSNSN